mgnify:CR=1 FL=1
MGSVSLCRIDGPKAARLDEDGRINGALIHVIGFGVIHVRDGEPHMVYTGKCVNASRSYPGTCTQVWC